MNIASRRTVIHDDAAPNTTCPPRRAFVASDARRRGQVCIVEGAKTIAFGAELPTPAMLASVDNSLAFRLMPDT
ncbi:hypothetical protein D5045_10285 [Verminephrobacter eiseniae]|uniref:hypothetical protein n=1 Tax=Verminephrobacter eiseniae TaxID=364317 RepID=UPI0022389530|nr:hypothetical protein [Verminephrobacter eiseniae]MCW5260592.1 hypothetical protein [Verminephrobacter eiseniae]